jgi:hypothetical protein
MVIVFAAFFRLSNATDIDAHENDGAAIGLSLSELLDAARVLLEGIVL